MSKEEKDLNKNKDKTVRDSQKETTVKTENKEKTDGEEIIHFDTDSAIAKEEEIKEQPKVDEAFLKVADELDRTKKSMLRLQADFDNYKKRNLEVSKKAYSDGIFDTVTELLPLLDSFDNAMKMTEFKDDQGIIQIKKQLDTILTTLNVSEIESLGQDFDPNLHNAVMKIDDEKNSGKIVEVFQKGYKLKDKIIRHTMVKVAN